MRRALILAVGLLALTPEAEGRRKRRKKAPKKPAAMSVERLGHSAVKLEDGSVLVVGGKGPSGGHDTAERYDPGTRSWTAAGSLAEMHIGHTATLLDDGRVLIAGGIKGMHPSSGRFLSASNEVWDPATSAFTPTGSMIEPRYFHTAVRLDDGRVLVAGGMDDGYRGPEHSEVWDPTTDRWSQSGRLNNPRSGHAMVVLPGGGAAVVGGVNGSTIETWDPASSSWTNAAQLTVERVRPTATVLGDGRILVVGGENGTNSALDSAEICDLTTTSCVATASLAKKRAAHQAVSLPGGEVAVVGGAIGFMRPTLVAEVEVWDPTTGTWRTVAKLAQSRHVHQANLLDDGTILVTGGSGAGLGGKDALDHVELVTP
jgi:N-acetylneuraminic acid mutarotase